LHIDQICGHLWANGFTCREEKISNINLALIIFLGNGFPVLIGKRKIGNEMVLGNILYSRVHQFWIYISRIVNRQCFFGFQCKIKQGNHNDGKHQQSTKEFSIVVEKGFHKNNLLQKYEKRVLKRLPFYILAFRIE
jgi:hypothetical protein